mgnify:CR=1 FL=1
MKFLIFAEDSKNAGGIASKLRDSGDVHAIIMKDQVEASSSYGIKKIYGLTGKPFADNVAESITKLNPSSFDLLVISSTTLGREVAGIISAKQNLLCATEVFDFTLQNGKIVTKRFFYGGKTIMEEESEAKIITVTPGSFDPQNGEKTSEFEDIQLPQSKVNLIETKPKEKSSTNIEGANIIVSVGRGIGKKESIDKIMPLVEATHGELAGSRPVCLDYKWLSEERQVGLSGKKVKPKVYIALGISGQIQHIAGMRGSKIVVAVNKDKDAPIFQESDYGIVGDIFMVVPKLVEALKK